MSQNTSNALLCNEFSNDYWFDACNSIANKAMHVYGFSFGTVQQCFSLADAFWYTHMLHLPYSIVLETVQDVKYSMS